MRVHFDNVSFGSHTGPNTFALRLAQELSRQGHDVTESDGNAADVSLVFIERTGKPLAKKVVQRLDGIWFKPQDFKTKNVGIRKLYERADAVVFQSQFDQQMITNWWKTPGLWNQPGRGVVIHNGIQQQPVTRFDSPELEHLRNTYDYVFTSSANWHPQKRLKANTDMYLHLRDNVLKGSKCAYIVMGANPNHVVADPHIFYTGVAPENVYMQVYSMANWMIHLAWLDHCPNTVIECLSQNTPVIYAESGGTRELARGFGICVNEAASYSFDLVDYDLPPNIDVSFVTELKTLKEQHPNLDDHADITIETCAKKYVDLFASLV